MMDFKTGQQIHHQKRSLGAGTKADRPSQAHPPHHTKRWFPIRFGLETSRPTTLVHQKIASNLLRLGVSLLSTATSISLLSLPVYAEGSRNLYPSGISGSRANLEWRTSSYGPTSGTNIKRRTLLWVYANSGEYILLGSSAVGRSNGDAVIYDSTQIGGTKGQETITGSPVFSCSTQRAGVGNLGATQGQIANRTQELLPPRNVANNAGGTGYIPCYYQAPSTGLYAIAFYGPAGAEADSQTTPTGTINFTSATDNNANDETSVYAWDVTVRSDVNSTTDITGRLFTYSIAFFTGGNNRPLNSTIYAVTLDGFIYKTDFNGIDPNGFLTYGNSRGFLDSDGVSPLYHNVVAQDGNDTQVAQLQALFGGTNFFPPEYPLFFQSPAISEVLPALGIPTTPSIPSISSLTFTGRVTGNTTLLGQGGSVSFTSTPGIYEVVINQTKDNNFDPGLSTNRVLKGITTGSISINWDGKDNSGALFPVGTDYPVRVVIHGGEYHFPMIDYEASSGGPTITMLNATNPVGQRSAFYDDRSYYTIGGTIVNPNTSGNTTNAPGAVLCGSGYNTTYTNPFTPFSTSTPFDTFTTRRSYTPANNANALCSGSFGDGKGLDLWAYYPGIAPTTYINIVNDFDFGDAPDTAAGTGTGNYETTLANAGPYHTIVSGLSLGTQVDADQGNHQSSGANLDDNGNTGSTDDEDSITSFPTLTATSNQSYTVSVAVTNSTGSDAFLVGYIDFNGNGDFADLGEASAAITVSSDGTTNPRSSNVTFTTPADISAGDTYARFRLSNTLTQVQSSIGPATSGEVEDYALTIAGNPDTYDYGDAPDAEGTPTTERYNTISTNSGAAHVLSSNLRMGTNAPDADSGLLQNTNANADDNNSSPDDEDGVTLPAFPSTSSPSNTSYSVTVRVTNNIGTSATLVGWIDFNRNGLFEETEGVSQVISDSSTTNRPFTLTWTGFPNLSSGNIYARFRLSNGGITTATPTGLVGSGEVEDYLITVANVDYGDAPDTTTGTGMGDYQTTLANGGPSHTIVTGLRLGTQVDADNGLLQNTGANNDDTANTDDEDSIASFPTLTATSGQPYTVSVAVTNSTGSDAFLVGYIDFNGDGDFTDPGEASTTVSVLGHTMNPRNFNVTFTTPADISAGDTYARFRLGRNSGQVRSPVGATANGEVEDYAITIAANPPQVLLVKRITRLNGSDTGFTSFFDDPASTDDNDTSWPSGFLIGAKTTPASPGDQIEYTIYFINTGGTPAQSVRICDPLSQYLEFVPNTYTGSTPTDGGLPTDLGIQLTLGSTPNYLTTINDPPDRGRFVNAGVDLTGTCKVRTSGESTPTLADDVYDHLTAALNPNGVVIVDLTRASGPTELDDVTPPDPADADDQDAYGFIRFRALVK